MLDLFQTDQADAQSPAVGQIAARAAPTIGEAFTATKDANDRLSGYGNEFQNQQDYLRGRMDDFTRRTGEALPALKFDDGEAGAAAYDQTYQSWLGGVRDRMTAVSQARNDPTLLPPSDQDIATGGVQQARAALQQQAQLAQGPTTFGSILGGTAAGAYEMGRSTLDPSNPLNALALTVAPEGGGVLLNAARMGGAMAGAQAYGDLLRYGYRQQVDPSYGARDLAGDVAGAFAGGALFGAGHVLGGEGLRGTLGASAGGALGGGALGGLSGGGPGAVQGAIGGAALPLAGAGVGVTSRLLGASWRAMVARAPELAADMPLDVRDAGTVAEKAGDLDAQNPFSGPTGTAAHGEAVAKIESDLLAGRAPVLPPAAEAEAQVRRGQVFYPGGAIEARYGVAELSDLITSHDGDFNTNPAYPADLQPRDRAGAPARDQVNNMATNLEPERLGPSPEANAGAPIVGPDGVVESGNGRTLAIARAYEMERGDAYRQYLEQQGYDTSGFDRPVLVGMRETPLDDTGRTTFAQAANGSASLRMSATEQALSDARLIDGSTLDLAQSPDLAAASNRGFARAVVAKLPAGERGGMLTREGSLSAGGAQRIRAALAARAYGDPAFLSRALDHPDPNIKAIAGAMGDSAAAWARMRDAATRGDIEPGHDITRDVLQAVHAIMRARDEGRPAWEMLNQGDIFQSDTTQLATRLFFRDEQMRQPAGRARIAEALTSYAEEAAKNTKVGRLFADNVGVGDVLRRVVSKVMPEASDEFVLASMRKIEEGGDWLGDMMRDLISGAEGRPAPPRMERSLEEALREMIAEAPPAERDETSLEAEMRKLIGGAEPAATDVGRKVYRAGDISYADEAPADAIDTSDLDYGGELEHEFEGETYTHDLDFRIVDDVLHAVVSGITHTDAEGETVASEDHLTRVQFYKLKKSIIERLKDGTLDETAEQLSDNERYNALSPEEQQAEDEAHETAYQASRDEELRARQARINAAVDGLVQTGWRPTVNRLGGWARPEALREFASPSSFDLINRRLLSHGIDVRGAQARAREIGGDVPASVRRSPEELTGALDQAAQDAAAPREAEPAPRARTEGVDEPGAEPQPDLTLRNPRTGTETQAQDVAPLADMLKRHAVDASADPLLRAVTTAMGDRLAKIAGDMKVYTVGPAEMRALAEGRMKIRAGMEPGGYFDPKAGHIVMLDDVLRRPDEALRTLVHEGLHGAFMDTINGSESARNVIDFLRTTATDAHLERGGEATDHYGLTNAHEFVSEAFSNPDFQRFLASVPADERTAAAFGLDRQPGNSLWDTFVAAVRRILGMAPDQHSLLDATMRVGSLLEQMREAEMRGPGDDLAPALRLADPDARRAAAVEEARKARAFADAKAAIAYRINSDRIAQHPNGPLAGFLGILTRDVRDARPSEGADRINVESMQQEYEGRMAKASEAVSEPYGSKYAGLKQDVAGIRDMIHELFGVDTKNETAKTAADAWKAGVDTYGVDEAKRLGKVFTAAEDWRVPQFWESRRAQKFGRPALLADMESEIAGGGLRVFDPSTGEEANPIRRRMILDDAATKIVTDASMGSGAGTGSGAFKTDMRVFRFADGRAGADAYLRLMDKYGAGRGGYLRMMQAHVGKVSRELGLMRVLGPDYMAVGEKLLGDAQQAHRATEALKPPRSIAERLRDLPGDAGKLAIGWLESPTKADAVWRYMSGQTSGVGSELMAGILSGTRAFLTSTRMGSAIVTAVPADTVNWLMAAKHNGLDMGRLVSSISETFAKDTHGNRELASRLGIVAHAGIDAAIGTKRFADQFVGEALMKRMADFVIRSQGLHAWDAAIRRSWTMEFLGSIADRGGKSLDELDEPFARFLGRYGLDRDWDALSQGATHDVGAARFLDPERLPEALRAKLASAINDEKQFAYLAGGSARVRATAASAKAGTLTGELARSVLLFKQFPMSMLATWGMRSAQEAAAGRFGMLASLVTGMTCAGALAMQARALLQGKDPRSMRDPYFWGESFLQGGAAGIYGDFFKEAFSRSDTSLTETMMGPLAAIPAAVQGLTSGARRMAEDGEKVNFGAKLARIISQNTPGGNIWYTRLLASRLLFDNIQRMIDPDHDAAFARIQRRAMKTDHQGFFWAPGNDAPARAPNAGAMLQ